MNHDSKRRVAIEDLLHLKRAERPPAEFWAEFDRQLRAKQLAALVGKRAWWQNFPRIFTGFSRYRLPLGAAAIMAVSFVSVRDYLKNSPASAEREQSAMVLVSNGNNVVNSVSVEGMSANESHEPIRSNVSSSVRGAGISAVSGGMNVETDALRGISQGIAAVRGSDSELPLERLASAPRFVDPSIKPAQPIEPVSSRGLLVSGSGFEARAMPARQIVEPLQQMVPPSERTRAKLLTAMVSMSSAETPMRSSDRAANRLSEERLYDQIHRFGARGAGVSMKF